MKADSRAIWATASNAVRAQAAESPGRRRRAPTRLAGTWPAAQGSADTHARSTPRPAHALRLAAAGATTAAARAAAMKPTAHCSATTLSAVTKELVKEHEDLVH